MTHSVKLFREKGEGLLSLFLFSESDSWEPLPKIKRNLYSEMRKEDQIYYDGLSNEVLLYRGTSIEEYESGKFGQSWSLKKGIANYFAFDLSQEKDNCGVRIVIKTMVKKENIYAYSSQNEEALCIVEPDIIIIDNVEIEETNE